MNLPNYLHISEDETGVLTFICSDPRKQLLIIPEANNSFKSRFCRKTRFEENCKSRIMKNIPADMVKVDWTPKGVVYEVQNLESYGPDILFQTTPISFKEHIKFINSEVAKANNLEAEPRDESRITTLWWKGGQFVTINVFDQENEICYKVSKCRMGVHQRWIGSEYEKIVAVIENQS